MSEQYRFFDSVDGEDERVYTADEFAEYFRQLITNGVFNGGSNLKVTSSETGMDIMIKEGFAWIEGYMYKLDSNPLILNISPASLTLNRIDRIVIRLDKRLENRHIKAFVLKGTESSNPKVPELTRDENIYEISLAKIEISAGESYILNTNIIDERLDEGVCGLVNSLIKLETADMEAEFRDFLDSMKGETYISRENLAAALEPFLAEYLKTLELKGKVEPMLSPYLKTDHLEKKVEPMLGQHFKLLPSWKLINVTASDDSGKSKRITSGLNGQAIANFGIKDSNKIDSISYDVDKVSNSNVRLDILNARESEGNMWDYYKDEVEYTVQSSWRASNRDHYNMFAIPFKVPSNIPLGLSRKSVNLKTKIRKPSYNRYTNIRFILAENYYNYTSSVIDQKVAYISMGELEVNMTFNLPDGKELIPSKIYYIIIKHEDLQLSEQDSFEIACLNQYRVPVEDRIDENKIYHGPNNQMTRTDNFAYASIGYQGYDLIKTDVKSGELLGEIPSNSLFSFDMSRSVNNSNLILSNIYATTKEYMFGDMIMPSNDVIFSKSGFIDIWSTSEAVILTFTPQYSGTYLIFMVANMPGSSKTFTCNAYTQEEGKETQKRIGNGGVTSSGRREVSFWATDVRKGVPVTVKGTFNDQSYLLITDIKVKGSLTFTEFKGT